MASQITTATIAKVSSTSGVARFELPLRGESFGARLNSFFI